MSVLIKFLLVTVLMVNLTDAEPLSIIDRSEVGDLIKLPFKIPSELLKLGTDLIVSVENFGINRASNIIQFFNQVGNALLDHLVAAGVLGGKTAQEIITFAVENVVKLAKIIWKAWIKTANIILDHLLQIIKTFKSLKDLLHFFAKLPVIKNIIQIITPFTTFVQDTLKNQTQLTVELIHTQVKKHSDFFEPILNGTAIRILIISNAFQALLDGNLEECAGNANLGSSPTGSLTWKTNLLIDKFKVVLFKFLGLSKLADDLEIATNVGFSKIPFGSAA